MLLENKTAIIYGGAGAVGGAVAKAFARDGFMVYLGGRTLKKLEAVADAIKKSGGKAKAVQSHFEKEFVQRTMLKRLPMLAEVANAAVLMASDNASGITGAVANVTCGELVD